MQICFSGPRQAFLWAATVESTDPVLGPNQDCPDPITSAGSAERAKRQLAIKGPVPGYLWDIGLTAKVFLVQSLSFEEQSYGDNR